jgi:hypothetical protein
VSDTFINSSPAHHLNMREALRSPSSTERIISARTEDYQKRNLQTLAHVYRQVRLRQQREMGTIVLAVMAAGSWVFLVLITITLISTGN